jgi:ADP-ribose pyrophosphatase YjhB (NUDIX family)
MSASVVGANSMGALPRGARSNANTFPCARCGRAVRRVAATKTLPERIGCPRCGYLIYDYPRPCAGMLVVKGADVLVLRRATPPRKGRLDIPGGFMEANESIEAAARRELKEETGLTLGAVEPLGFYWDQYTLKGFGAFPTMNFYFVGQWRRGTPVAADDAASAEWLPIASLPRRRADMAWAHMPQLVRDLARWRKGAHAPVDARAWALQAPAARKARA